MEYATELLVIAVATGKVHLQLLKTHLFDSGPHQCNEFNHFTKFASLYESFTHHFTTYYNLIATHPKFISSLSNSLILKKFDHQCN